MYLCCCCWSMMTIWWLYWFFSIYWWWLLYCCWPSAICNAQILANHIRKQTLYNIHTHRHRQMHCIYYMIYKHIEILKRARVHTAITSFVFFFFFFFHWNFLFWSRTRASETLSLSITWFSIKRQQRFSFFVLLACGFDEKENDFSFFLFYLCLPFYCIWMYQQKKKKNIVYELWLCQSVWMRFVFFFIFFLTNKIFTRVFLTTPNSKVTKKKKMNERRRRLCTYRCYFFFFFYIKSRTHSFTTMTYDWWRRK